MKNGLTEYVYRGYQRIRGSGDKISGTKSTCSGRNSLLNSSLRPVKRMPGGDTSKKKF